MFGSAFSSITKMLIKKASLNFKVANTVESLSEHKLKQCSKFCEQIGYARCSASAEQDHSFPQTLKKATTGKNGEFSSCLKKLSSASMCTFPSQT